MEKIKTFITILCTFFLGLTVVSAACSTEESNRLNSLAVNVKASYEIVTKEIPAEENFNTPDGLTEEEIENYKYYRTFFKIYINNLTEELYVKVTNKNTGEVTTYRFEDTEKGVITFEKEVFITITNYVIDVYSSGSTNCQNTKLYTLYLTTPMYNSLSESSLCEGIKDYYLCHEYLSVDVSFENYEQKLRDYRKGKVNNAGEEIKDNENAENDKISFYENNKALIICVSIVVLLVGTIITVIIVKKQRSKKI